MTPPDSWQPRRSPDRPDPSRPSGASPDGAGGARLAPREQARIDEAVVRVGPGRGAGPILVATLVVAGFLMGLVRPWDWLVDDATIGSQPSGLAAAATAGAGAGDNAGIDGGPLATDGTSGSSGGSGRDPGSTPAPASLPAPTCGWPTSWRTAAISFWAGARARIWTAAVAVPASGPADPSIPFHLLASDTVEAIGWCAPVNGPERPPLAAVGTLFRLRDGVATEIPVDRLEPAARDALGELWVPPARNVDRRPPWTPGRYVVRLATPSGSYVRYLGLEVGVPGATPSPSPGSTGRAPQIAAPGARRPRRSRARKRAHLHGA